MMLQSPNGSRNKARLGEYPAADGRIVEVETALQQTLQMNQENFGENHLRAYRAMEAVERFYLDHSRAREAETLLRKAHDGFAEHLGLDHESTRALARSLGGLRR